jgi:hypothetical protein
MSSDVSLYQISQVVANHLLASEYNSNLFLEGGERIDDPNDWEEIVNICQEWHIAPVSHLNMWRNSVSSIIQAGKIEPFEFEEDYMILHLYLTGEGRTSELNYLLAQKDIQGRTYKQINAIAGGESIEKDGNHRRYIKPEGVIEITQELSSLAELSQEDRIDRLRHMHIDDDEIHQSYISEEIERLSSYYSEAASKGNGMLIVFC